MQKEEFNAISDMMDQMCRECRRLQKLQANIAMLQLILTPDKQIKGYLCPPPSPPHQVLQSSPH